MFTKKDALARIEVQKQVDALSTQRDRLLNKGDTEEAARVQKKIEALEGTSSSAAPSNMQNVMQQMHIAQQAIFAARGAMIKDNPTAMDLAEYKQLHELMEQITKMMQAIQKLHL